MKQYCRYCNYLTTGNGIYCSFFNEELSESKTKSVNVCKGYKYNPVDAYNPDHTYHPRAFMKKKCDNQMTLW